MLIIGCGNPDRGDDAAGILIADALRRRGVNARAHSGDGLALIDLWAAFDDVVIVDAMVSGEKPGVVRWWDPHTDSRCRTAFRGSTHVFGPAEAIEIARALGRLPERMRLCGIEGRVFGLGSAPSPEVLQAIDRLVEELSGSVMAAGAAAVTVPQHA